MEEEPAYRRMDEETAQVVSTLMGVGDFMDKRDKYRKEGMYNMCQALQEMMEDSRLDGRAEGKAEFILELLEDLGDVSEDLRKEILVQRDPETLKRWHKLAARSFSIQDFESKMK